MIFVIPIFAKMFLELSGGKVALPGPTQLVIDISNFFHRVLVRHSWGYCGDHRWY